MSQTSKVFLQSTELQVGETAKSVTEHIVRSGSLADPVTITYGITGSTATVGKDFVGGLGTVTMAAGVSDVAVTVQILDDTLAESTEVAVFSLIDVDGATLWAPRTSRISILDDETPAPAPPAEPPPLSNYVVSMEPVVSGLDQPIKFLFSPLNPSTAYIAEKRGVIVVADIKTGTTKVMLDIQDQVNTAGDRGLMGIALHPDFVNNPYIYAFYVADPSDTKGKYGNAGPDGGGNRYAEVVRYTADAATGFTTVVPGSKVVLVGAGGKSLKDINLGGTKDFTDPAFKDEIASDQYINPAQPAPTVINGFKQDYLKDDSVSHIGGALAFGPDGALYVSVGDGTSFNFTDPRAPNVQSLDSLSGKILRIDPMTGLGLADNPFVSPGVALTDNRAKVYQLGLRNPFSISFDTEGRLFIANTGWDSWEAINMGGPGANFGWPYYEGGDNGVALQTPNFRDFPSAKAFYAGVANGTSHVTPAFRAFSHNSGDPGYQVQAITGGAVAYTGSVYPAEFLNDYFFSDFSGGEIYTVDVNDRSALKFLLQRGPSDVPIDYIQGADGYVYYSNIVSGEIGRMLITALPPSPPPGSATIGAGPDTLSLKVSQDAFNGNALYTIHVDGVRMGGYMTALAAHGSGTSDTITLRGDWATGPHAVTVDFLNDAWGGRETADRNLYVDSVTYNGAAVVDSARFLGGNGPMGIGFTDRATTPAPASGVIAIGSSPTLVLKVSQDAYAGNAQYTVKVDGVAVGGTLVATALHGSGASDTVSVRGNWAIGAHVVTVDFLNDGWGGSAAADRNLYVDSATLDGAAVPGAGRALMARGPVDIAFGEGTAGTIAPDSATIGAGRNALVLKVSQDAYRGSAQYSVKVDGVAVGSTLMATGLHGAGASDTLNVRGDWGAGAHVATVDFLNDAWDGTQATDRNLFVDSATYDGAAVADAARSLWANGPASIGFTDSTPPTPPASGVITIGSSPTLVLKVSQDAYAGDAQYTVAVDGVRVGGTLVATASHGSGASDIVSVGGNWRAGAHVVTVDFLNDAWNGTAATDRNLYVDSATYNGATVTNAALTLNVTGPKSFTFLDGTAATVGTPAGAVTGGTPTAAARPGSAQPDSMGVPGAWNPGDTWDGIVAPDRTLYGSTATVEAGTIPDQPHLVLSAGQTDIGAFR